ncbi:MAG: ABC transporter substrate-binding protein [Xanthobacteraceae bacterium]
MRAGRVFTALVVLTSLGAAGALAQANSNAGPIRIGVLEDMSGPLADLGGPGNVLGVRMAVEDFGGEVLGRKIEVLSGDDQNKPDIGLSIVRRWFDIDNVNMVTGLGNSGVALAVQNLAKERKRVNIVIGSAATDLSGKMCSPTGFQWNWSTRAIAATVVNGMMDNQQANSWYFLTVDYAFGHSMEQEASAIVREKGGVVSGAARHPLGTVDYASFILQAQGSKAQVVALANVSADLVNSVKTAKEFGVAAGGQKLAAFVLSQNDAAALGPTAAQGLLTAAVFFPGMNDETRSFSERFAARSKGKMPGANQAGAYSATLHYLKAVKAAGTDAPEAVAAAMRNTPVTDLVNKDARIRADGRLMRNLYLAEMKGPSEVRFPGDFYKIVTKIDPETAFGKISDACVIEKQ